MANSFSLGVGEDGTGELPEGLPEGLAAEGLRGPEQELVAKEEAGGKETAAEQNQ